MPVVTYTIPCLRNDIIADGVYEFELRKPTGFTFNPGQFVLFDVPLVENPSDVQTRAFSIASTPAEETLLFVAKMIPGGRASRWIEEMLRVGTDVVTKGPFGNFLLKAEPEQSLLFIATSTGNAPFRSMILDALARGDTRRMDFIFGVKSEKDLFWAEEFEELAKSHPNFFFHTSLSAPTGEWTGHRGRVQTLVPQVVKDFSQLSVYVCGNPAMTKEVKEMAIGQWGMDKKHVHAEGYI